MSTSASEPTFTQPTIVSVPDASYSPKMLTTADILKVVTDLEQEAKSPTLPVTETYVVDLLSILGMVVGVFRPDLRTEISAIPQTAIFTIALAALFAINWVRLHERAAVKKKAMDLAAATRSSLIQ